MTKSTVLLVVLSCVMLCQQSVPTAQSQNRDGFPTQLAGPAKERDAATGPQLLTYNELIELYQQDVPTELLRNKLNRLLATPFVSNRATSAGVRPLKPNSPQTGKYLRVMECNIERGLEFDAIKLAISDPRKFADLMDQKGSRATTDERARILDQAQLLKQADVLVLNEVDWGVNRTLFRNVADQRASGWYELRVRRGVC